MKKYLTILFVLMLAGCGGSISGPGDECQGPGVQDCDINNGTGEQARSCQGGSWSAWDECEILACDQGYELEDGACVDLECSFGDTRVADCAVTNGSGQLSQICSDASVWEDDGICQATGCDPGYLLLDGACVDLDCHPGDTRVADCVVTNGSGQLSQICSDASVWEDDGICQVIGCDLGYHQQGEACEAECGQGESRTLDCLVENGSGAQEQVCSADGVWTDAGSCAVIACDSGYRLQDEACVPLDPDQSYEIMPEAYGANLLEFSVDAGVLVPPVTTSLGVVLLAGNQVDPPVNLSLDEAAGAVAWAPTPSQVGEYDLLFDLLDSTGTPGSVVVHVHVLTPPICTGGSAACVFLEERWDAGQAAGNLGDWYHNRDDFHTRLNMGRVPQADLMTDGYGSETGLHPDRVVVGNSSTAYTSGAAWMSQMRSLMFSSYIADAVYQQYINNNHYWYPEHRDHDDKDHYHAKYPYVTSSQGSSGSEMDEVMNFVFTLAAFQPATKDLLREQGLLIPTVQMIFRRARVLTDEAYLTGAAHPSAFDDFDGGLEMVEMANAMLPGEIPPLIQLEVLEENYGLVDGKQEQLFSTPASICRIFRGPEYAKRMVVSAEGSYDANDRPLTYHWAVLRGDPAQVRITPQNAEATVVEILIDYHPETTVDGSALLTNLVEVGAFVNNGVWYSAPGFVTDFTLANEERTYDGNGQLVEILTNGNYVHPSLL